MITVREEPDQGASAPSDYGSFRFSLRRRFRKAAVSGLGVGVRHSGTLEGGTQLGGFRSKPLELGGVESNPIPSHHLAGDLRNSLLHGPTPNRHIIADRFGARGLHLSRCCRQVQSDRERGEQLRCVPGGGLLRDAPARSACFVTEDP